MYFRTYTTFKKKRTSSSNEDVDLVTYELQALMCGGSYFPSGDSSVHVPALSR